MDPRDELVALRRLAELEAKAGGAGAAPAPRAPVEDPGIGQSLLIGAGRTFDRVGKGIQQLYYGATGNDAEQAALKQRAADDDAAYKPLQEARPWATGIGEALPSLAIPAGGGASLLANAGRMATAGALPGLLEYGSAEDRGQRGLLGAAAGAALPVAGMALKTGKAFIEPLYEGGADKLLFKGGQSAIAGRTLNRAAGADAPAVAQRMASAAELVPGSAPTAGQVARNGGVAALERAAGAVDPQAYAQRAMEQSSARLQALRGIAGDDAAMAAAEAGRGAATKPLYAAADAGVAPLDATFTSLLQRPQFKAAVARAEEMARNDGLADIFFRGADGAPTALLGEGAHLLKKALDEAGEFGAKSYTGKQGARTANSTNDMFQQWLGKSIPEYRAARDTFAKASEPINQMQVGRSLLDAVSPALADHGALGRETGATYARALRNADQTAAKAIGMPGKRMADIMAPAQMDTINAVGQDLARKANAQDLGRGVGSDTVQKLAMQNIAEQSGMPRMVGGLLNAPVISPALRRWVYEGADEKLQQQLAEALLDPKKAAALMQSAKGPDATIVRRVLQQSAMRAGLLGAPALGNAVAP